MTTSSLSDIMPYSCWGVHDVDGDQLPDVICSGWESPAILHNDGGRVFTEMNFASPLLPNEWFSATRSVDIDGDGSNEILQGLDDGTLRFLNLTLNGGTLETVTFSRCVTSGSSRLPDSGHNTLCVAR